MVADHVTRPSTSQGQTLCDSALLDWGALTLVTLMSGTMATHLLSQRLKCPAHHLHTLQLAEKLRLYLDLPLPLRLLLQHHSIILSALQLRQLAGLLDAPPEQLAAGLDELAELPPNAVYSAAAGRRRWELTQGVAVATASPPLPGGSAGLSAGDMLLLFVSSGWLSYDPYRRGLAQPQLRGPQADDASVLSHGGPRVPQDGGVDAGEDGGVPGGEYHCRYVWNPRQQTLGSASAPVQPPGAKPQQQQQPLWWMAREGLTDPEEGVRGAAGGMAAAGTPRIQLQGPSPVQSMHSPVCRTITAVVGARANAGGRRAPAAAGTRLVRLGYDLYDTPGSHLQRHPLIGASLDRLLFIHLTTDLRPRPRPSYGPPQQPLPRQPPPPRPTDPAGQSADSLQSLVADHTINTTTTTGTTTITTTTGSGGNGAGHAAAGRQGRVDHGDHADGDPLSALLTRGLVVAGRRYRRLVVKDAGKAGEKICFFAQDTLSYDDVRHGFRSLGPPSAVRLLLADVGTAVGAAREAAAAAAAATAADAMGSAAAAAAAKAASRPELFLSATWPMPVDAASVSYIEDLAAAPPGGAAATGSGILGVLDGGSAAGSSSSTTGTGSRGVAVSIVNSSGGKGKAGVEIMTDGNGLICAQLARTIPHIYQGVPLSRQQPQPQTQPQLPTGGDPVGVGPGAACTPYGAGSGSAAAAAASSIGAGGVATEPSVEPALQLRVYDPRVGAVIKGTFTPVVSGLPPGASLLVRASQVKAPGWGKLLALLGRRPPTHSPSGTLLPAAGAAAIPLPTQGTSSQSTQGSSSQSTQGTSSGARRPSPGVTGLPSTGVTTPAAAAQPRSAWAPGPSPTPQPHAQLPLLPARWNRPGAAAAAAEAAARNACVSAGSGATAMLEVVRKMPSRPGAVARLNGPLLLLLSGCCVSARTMYDIVQDELRRVLAAQRGDLAAAREMARRGGDAALEGALLAEYDMMHDSSAMAARRADQQDGQQGQQGLGQAGDGPVLMAPIPVGNTVVPTPLDFRMRDWLQAVATRGWQQLWTLRMPLSRSVTLLGVPDPSGSVPEGCVVALPGLDPGLDPDPGSDPVRGAGGSPGAGAAVMGEQQQQQQQQQQKQQQKQLQQQQQQRRRQPPDEGRDVVVYRFPGLHPRDLRKLRLIAPPPQLLQQLGLAAPSERNNINSSSSGGGGGGGGSGGGGGGGGDGGGTFSGTGPASGGATPVGGGSLLVFSSAGSQPAVSGLSGGDYDGDQYTLIWDERVVSQFEEYPAEEEEEGQGAGSGATAAARDPFAAQLVSLEPPAPKTAKGNSEPQEPQEEAGRQEGPGGPAVQPPVGMPGETSSAEGRRQVGGSGRLGVPWSKDLEEARRREEEEEQEEEQEEAYLTRRYYFCHEAAGVMQEAYRLWGWCADEYGADHPNSIMLCRLYQEALDAPKSGFFHRLPHQLRDRVRPPHWALGPRQQPPPPPQPQPPSWMEGAIESTATAQPRHQQPRRHQARMQVPDAHPFEGADPTHAQARAQGRGLGQGEGQARGSALSRGTHQQRVAEAAHPRSAVQGARGGGGDQAPGEEEEVETNVGAAGHRQWAAGGGEEGSGGDGGGSGSGEFVQPRFSSTPVPSWLRPRVRTSTSVLAGVYELLQRPEYRLPQLDPRLIANDLPFVRRAEAALATHGSDVRRQLREHWCQASAEWEQLTQAALRSMDPDPALLYQHQQHDRRGPTTGAAAAAASPSVAASLRRILLDATNIMTRRLPTEPGPRSRGAEPQAAHNPVGSNIGGCGHGGNTGDMAAWEAGSTTGADAPASASDPCPCWLGLLQSHTSPLPQPPPLYGSQPPQPLCPPERCRSAGAAGLPCAQQAAVSCLAGVYEQQWGVVQRAARWGHRARPRLRLLWQVFGPVLPALRRRAG